MTGVTIKMDLEEAKKVLLSRNREIAEMEERLAQRKAARDIIVKQIAEAEQPTESAASKRRNQEPGAKIGAVFAIRSLLEGSPDRKFTQGEIVKEADVSQPSAARVLKDLVAAGAVRKEAKLYSAT